MPKNTLKRKATTTFDITGKNGNNYEWAKINSLKGKLEREQWVAIILAWRFKGNYLMAKIIARGSKRIVYQCAAKAAIKIREWSKRKIIVSKKESTAKNSA